MSATPIWVRPIQNPLIEVHAGIYNDSLQWWCIAICRGWFALVQVADISLPGRIATQRQVKLFNKSRFGPSNLGRLSDG